MDQRYGKSGISFLKCYDRRPGTNNQGIDFETNITALVALRSIALEDTEDMWMGSNVAQFGDFDDIVLYRRTTEGRRLIYMMQLKHQETPTNITKSEFENIKGHFSVSKYSKTFNSLKEQLVCKDNYEHEVIQYLRDVDDRVFVLYTNKGVDQCDFLEKHYDSTIDFLDTSSSTENRFKFSLNQSEIPENFILFSNQITANNATNVIERDINLLLGPSFRLSTIQCNRVVNEFVEFIRTWAKGANVNNSKKYYTLTKYDVISKLTGILLGPYQYKLSDETFSNCSETPIWSKITRDKNITIVDSDQSVNVFLNQYIAGEVRKYLRGFEESWTDKLYKKTLKLISNNDEDLVMTLLKMNVNRKEITNLDLYTSLWISNRIPLLLKVDTIKDYEDILKILNLSNYSLHVIIIKNKTLKLDHKIVSTIKYFITCDDLNQEEKSTILNQPIKLQNRPNHTLGNVVDESMYKFVSCKDVIQILQGNFNVGNEYEPLTDFHIERTLSRVFLNPVVLKKIKDEIFILKSVDIGCLRYNEIGFANNVIHVIKSKTLEEEKWRGNVIHEMIIYGDGNLEWKRSFGTTKNILKYVKQQKKAWIDFQDDQNYFLNGLHVITAAPGMGKSTFADFMAVRVPANIWVIKVVLNKYEEYYENIQHNSGSNHLKFFKDQLLHKCENLELSNAIFQKCFDAKKVLLILDGFDEIVMDFEEIVINIANCLQDEGFPLWLTTRPNRKSELEETFCTIALTLNPLTVDDQRIYLNKYFSRTRTSGNLNQELFQSVIGTFVDRLIEKVKHNFNDSRGKFMAIPLHVKLLAEVFSADCEKSLQTGSIILNETFHLVDLYERFIKRKIDIVCEKFGKDAKRSRRYIEKHQKLFALKYLYPEKRLKQLKINEQLDEYYSGEEYRMYFLQREGIVVVEQKGNGEKLHYNINFTHRTFAEYLAAQWFSEYFSNPDCKLGRILKISDIFHNKNLIYYMFNLILSKDCPLHVAVLTGNFDKAKKILETDLTRASEPDKWGRTVLHIIAIKGNVNLEITNILQTISNYSIRDTKDLIRTFTALDYAVANQEYRLANQMCELFPNLAVTSTISSTSLLLECANNTYNSLFNAALRYAVSSHLLADSRDKNLSVISYFSRIPYEQQNRSILHYTREFDTITISEFLQFKNQSNDSSIGHYYYDLDIACALGTEENVNYLLSKGAQINSSNFETTCLHYASRHNRLEIVKLLLDNGAQINSLNETGQSALHWAASSDIVTELLSKGADINKLDINHDTPLSIALKNGKLDIARLLLLHDAKCKLDDCSGYSPLHSAAGNNYPDIITELLSKGVCVDVQNKDGDTPLNIALMKGNLDIARLLLLQGANCNLENTSGYSSLHYATKSNCPDIVTELLLSKGVSINQKNKVGDTPLNIALSNRNLDVAKLLLLKGADGNLENTSGYSSLHYAAQSNCPEIVTKLLSTGVCIDKKTNDGDTPLHIALSNTNLDIAKLLLLNGANGNLENTSGYSSLHYAAQSNCPDIITELLLKDACINQQNKNGDTPLSIALSKRKLDIAKLLLLKGANCNLENTFGYSSLHYAARSNCPDIITELLSKGVSINQQIKSGYTPLHLALFNRNVDIARFLLQKGADCKLENRFGWSSLHFAARSNCADVITELLSKDILVNTQDVHGDTPLHIAVEYFATDTAKLLLSNGADLNLQNKNGQTPLHIAVIKQLYYPNHIPLGNRISVVSLILENGADLNIKDKYGDTPMAYASEDESLFAGDEADLNLFKQFHNEAKILLLERGASTNKKN